MRRVGTPVSVMGCNEGIYASYLTPSDLRTINDGEPYPRAGDGTAFRPLFASASNFNCGCPPRIRRRTSRSGELGPPPGTSMRLLLGAVFLESSEGKNKRHGVEPPN